MPLWRAPERCDRYLSVMLAFGPRTAGDHVRHTDGRWHFTVQRLVQRRDGLYRLPWIDAVGDTADEAVLNADLPFLPRLALIGVLL